MASVMRYRRGDCAPIQLATSSTYPIEVGDLVFIDPADSKTARNAASQADQKSEALNQDTFRQNFAGVALQKIGLQTNEKSFELNTDPGQVVVGTQGEYEFDCAATTWYPGDLVGPVEASSGTALEDQKVAKVTAYRHAIGVAVPEANAIGVSRTKVIVRLFSTKFAGGVNEPTTGSSSSGTV